MRYGFIEEHKVQFAVAAMCRVLGVSRNAYYAWRGRPLSERAQSDEAIGTLIEVIFHDSNESYGSPRVHLELQLQGVCCGRKRVARLMQQRQLRASAPRRFVITTDSNHAWPVAENVLNREYQVKAIPEMNRTWAGDIT